MIGVLTLTMPTSPSTLIPRLSGPWSYGHFDLPGTLCTSFSGSIATLLSLFVEIVTSHAISMAFAHENVCYSELRTFQSYGQCPVLDRPNKRGQGLLESRVSRVMRPAGELHDLAEQIKPGPVWPGWKMSQTDNGFLKYRYFTTRGPICCK